MIYITAPLCKLRPLTRLTGGGSAIRSVWSNSISFSSPESDFTSNTSNIFPLFQMRSPNFENVENTGRHSWSKSISFSSPESDFTSHAFPQAHKQSVTDEKEKSDKNNWSGMLSYSSPESDFTTSAKYYANKNEENQETHAPKADFIHHVMSDPYHRDSMAYSMSFAGTESDFCSSNFMDLLDERMKRQLENVEKRSLKRRNDLKLAAENHDLNVMNVPSNHEVELQEAPLPRTYARATEKDDPRAIVVTEASKPFRIVSVNSAWEQLCGFSAAECQGKTLECLQGPETDYGAISSLMAQLQKGEESRTVLTNYTKTGRKFQNSLRVGPLVSEDDKVTHVVGVLREIVEAEHQFRNGNQKIKEMNA